MSIGSFQKKTEIYLKSRSGMGSILTILGAAVAAAIIVFPLVRWQISLSQNVATTQQELQDMSTDFEARAALEDRWQQINNMAPEEFRVAQNKWSKGTATRYGKYLIWEKFGSVGKYNSANGQCESGTLGVNDKACRITTLQATDLSGNTVYKAAISTRVAIEGISVNPVIEEWHDGFNWYKKYKNGWCEQGGIEPTAHTVSAYRQNIYLHVPMKDDKYSIIISSSYRNGTITLGSNTCGYGVLYGSIQEPTYFQILECAGHFSFTNWRVEGFYK